MTIWWVNLGLEYAIQRENNALWCPNKTKSDDRLTSPQWHWSTITEVQPGDILICGNKKLIMGLCVASAVAEGDAPKLERMDPESKWHTHGWRLPVNFVEAALPLVRANTFKGLSLPTGQNGPFSKTGLTQTYLTKVPVAVASEIVDIVADEVGYAMTSRLEKAIEESAPDETTRKRLVDARLGQGKFRADLMKLWKEKCCATGVNQKELLRASHILPWKDSSNAQRLDRYNGLLLTASYDAAFDSFLLTVDEQGLWSSPSWFTEEQQRRAGLGDLASFRIVGLEDRHMSYLARHRKIARRKWALIEAENSVRPK